MSQDSVSLDELVNPSLMVTLRGKEYRVNPIDGFAQQLTQGMTKENSVSVMYRIAARCLAPGMTRDEVFGSEDVIGLTPQQVMAVCDVARRQTEAVEATAPFDGQAGAQTGEAVKAPPPPPGSPLLTLSAS